MMKFFFFFNPPLIDAAQPCERLQLRYFHYHFLRRPLPAPAASVPVNNVPWQSFHYPTLFEHSHRSNAWAILWTQCSLLWRLIVFENINITSVILLTHIFQTGGGTVSSAEWKGNLQEANWMMASRFAMPRVRWRNGFGCRQTVRWMSLACCPGETRS